MKRIKTIADLTPDPNNSNMGTQRGAALLAKSIETLGAGRSILADKHGVVLAGNKTLEQAAALGLKIREVQTNGNELVVVRRMDLDAETDKAARELAIADNQTGAVGLKWDTTQLGLDIEAGVDVCEWFYDSELEAMGLDMGEKKGPPAPQIDKAEELQAKWQVKTGDIWVVPSATVDGGAHRLLCGDCTVEADVGRLMGGACPLLMVTDPPYGVNYNALWRQEAAEKGQLAYSSKRIGKVENDDRVNWGDAWRLFCGDVCYVWHDGRYAGVVGESLEQNKIIIRTQIIWRKPAIVISRGHYNWQHESCLYAVRKGATAHWCGGYAESTVWDITPAADDIGDKGHGTQKPLECMARPIRNHEGDVYDPFIGSGTTMVAAEQEGRLCYGVEISEKYCAVVLQRMADMGLVPEKVEVSCEKKRSEI